MKVLKEVSVISNTCIGLGFFDGVHKGHLELINKLVELSKKTNTNSVIVTFQKSPAECFYNDVDYITTNSEKEEILNSLGVDYAVELDFDKNMMQMTAKDYLEKILYSNFKPKYILTGFNHTFGKEKAGNALFLNKYQEKYNYKYIEIPPVKTQNDIISSSFIKTLLNKGDIKKANELLGHCFKISGTIIKGNQIGRTIGFPTANIKYPEIKTKIPFGVYCAEVSLEDKQYKGMLNYGIKPTINNGKNEPVAEVHIIGFNNDIYGKQIDISILNKIRDEKIFNSLDELKKQIKEDLKRC